jgi:hypothetical protein
MSHPHHHNNTKLYPWTYLGVYLWHTPVTCSYKQNEKGFWFLFLWFDFYCPRD